MEGTLMKKSLNTLFIGVASLALLTSCSSMPEVDYATFHELATAVEDITYSSFSSEGSYTDIADGKTTTYDLATTFELTSLGLYNATSGTTEAQVVVYAIVSLIMAKNVDEDDCYTYYADESGFKLVIDEVTSESTSFGTYKFNSYGYLTSVNETSTDSDNETVTIELTITYVE